MDEMILHDLLKIFGDVFGTLPKVKNYKMTHWDTNQFYRGSWCYWKKNDGDTPRGLDACKMVQNLANNNLLNEEPINGYNHHLLFAGDWTQSGYGCCYHAHQSGKRVAMQVMKSMKD